MPLTRLDDNYWEQDGDVVFRMTDGNKLVVCRVSREALSDYTGTSDPSVIGLFEAHRKIVEQAASDVYDGGDSFDHQGRVLVNLAALKRASREPR